MGTINRLEAGEWDYLTKHFRICESPPSNSAVSIPSADLLDEEKCAAYLDQLTGVLQSPSRMVTASMFSKRYAFLTVVPGLYAMTMYNKGIDLSIGSSHLETSPDQRSWLSHIRLGRLHVSLPAAGKRSEWRDRIANSLFAEHLAPIWRSVSKVANVPMPILWENTAVRLFSLYEKRMEAEAGGEARSRMQEDFEYLIGKAPASLFGETRNPFGRFYGGSRAVSASKPSVRIRKTCCYYYQVSTDREYCTVCPKLHYAKDGRS